MFHNVRLYSYTCTGTPNAYGGKGYDKKNALLINSILKLWTCTTYKLDETTLASHANTPPPTKHKHTHKTHPITFVKILTLGHISYQIQNIVFRTNSTCENIKSRPKIIRWTFYSLRSEKCPCWKVVGRVFLAFSYLIWTNTGQVSFHK